MAVAGWQSAAVVWNGRPRSTGRKQLPVHVLSPSTDSICRGMGMSAKIDGFRCVVQAAFDSPNFKDVEWPRARARALQTFQITQERSHAQIIECAPEP